MNKQILLTIMVLVSVVLSACGGEPPPAETAPLILTVAFSQLTQEPAATETTVPTVEMVIITETPTTENAPASISFATDVMPIIEARCIKCHGVQFKKEGLDLQTYDNLMAGSRNGSVIEPGNSTDSLLVQLIIEGKMPNRGPKVTDEELQLIRDWIDQGALNN